MLQRDTFSSADVTMCFPLASYTGLTPLVITPKVLRGSYRR
jgi:hypothetical protein